MSYNQKAKDAKSKVSQIGIIVGSEKSKINILARAIQLLADAIIELGEEIEKIKKELKTRFAS